MSDSSTSGGEGEEGVLCNYERKRLENIRRNQEMLKTLGKNKMAYSGLC